jgi:hypothetical protein
VLELDTAQTTVRIEFVDSTGSDTMKTVNLTTT